MQLAIFDLDHTLLTDDSDFLWGQFLCDEGHSSTVGISTSCTAPRPQSPLGSTQRLGRFS